MDAADRISDLFNQLLSRGHDRVFDWPFAEQIVFLVVCARCEKDMEGFESVFQQLFGPQEFTTLIEGLHKIGEPQLGREFSSAFEMLNQEGFFGHRNWDLVSPAMNKEIEQIGNRIGDGLWGLDEKLVAFVEMEETKSSRDRQA